MKFALLFCALVAVQAQDNTEPPTAAPTEPPTAAPTEPPTAAPTAPPTAAPTEPPTAAPTEPPVTPQPPTDPIIAPPITLDQAEFGSGCPEGCIWEAGAVVEFSDFLRECQDQIEDTCSVKLAYQFSNIGSTFTFEHCPKEASSNYGSYLVNFGHVREFPGVALTSSTTYISALDFPSDWATDEVCQLYVFPEEDLPTDCLDPIDIEQLIASSALTALTPVTPNQRSVTISGDVWRMWITDTVASCDKLYTNGGTLPNIVAGSVYMEQDGDDAPPEGSGVESLFAAGILASLYVGFLA